MDIFNVYCLTDFLTGMIKKPFCRWEVGMVAHQCECPSHLRTVHLKMAKMVKFMFCINFYHLFFKKYILQLEYYAIGFRLSLDESFIKQGYSNSLHLLRNRETMMPSLQY